MIRMALGFAAFDEASLLRSTTGGDAPTPSSKGPSKGLRPATPGAPIFDSCSASPALAASAPAATVSAPSAR